MHCANCKRKNPEFKCGGCANATYCSKVCATLHWEAIHVRACSFELIDASKRERSVDVFELARNGDVEGLREAYLSGAARVNDHDVQGNTVLIVAARLGMENVIRFLLRSPTIDINAWQRDGFTALLVAIINYNEECVRLLLNDPRTDVNASAYDGWTPLKAATRYNTFLKNLESIVSLLLAHPNINVNDQSSDGWTALMHAARYSNRDSTEGIVKLLLSDPRTNVNIQNTGGYTALMMATHYIGSESTEETVRLLLNHPATNPMITNNKGETAMDLCPTIRCKLFIYSLVIAKKRLGDPQIPFQVARVIMARKIQMEICEGLVEGTKENLLELASLLQVPEEMIQQLKNQSREEVCTFVSDVIAMGAVWDYDLYHRRQRQKIAQIAQGYFNKFRDFMIDEFNVDIKWMTTQEVQDTLSRLVNL